jgi:hypothetical protein
MITVIDALLFRPKVAIGDDVGNIAHGSNKHEFISQLRKNELPLSLSLSINMHIVLQKQIIWNCDFCTYPPSPPPVLPYPKQIGK